VEEIENDLQQLQEVEDGNSNGGRQ